MMIILLQNNNGIIDKMTNVAIFIAIWHKINIISEKFSCDCVECCKWIVQNKR